MPKQEILPPERPSSQVTRRDTTTVSVSPPRIHTGGIVESTLTRWEANRQSRAVDAITRRTQSESALMKAQTEVMETYVARHRAAYRVQELPEILANDRAQRRVERANQLRDVQHRYEMAETKRLTELSHAQATLTDAQQALAAQRSYGDLTYKLAWRRKGSDMLEIELSDAERRAVLRQHTQEMDGGSSQRLLSTGGDETEETIDDALHERRSQLAASGIDTSRVDDAIERRRARRRDGE